jgi:hypothetical protein
MTRLQRTSLPTASQLLYDLFENPNLVAAVQALPGPTLGKFIDSVGLEDAAELVALATTQQLESVFDEDLWKSRRSDWEEHFDPARFALWLHAFSEAGQDAVIQRLIELPLDFVILAVHRLILVIDIDSLAVEMSESNDDLDRVEKALESCLYEEWEEFRLIARDDSVWDELTSALFSLDRDHHDLLRKILERCTAMSSEWIEDNGGLYEVLSSDEMLEGDMRAERNDRRASKGYVSAADARAFLELARHGTGDPTVRDAITNAYFRELARTPPKAQKLHKAPAVDSSANLRGLLKLLEQAKVIEPAPKAHPAASSSKQLSASSRQSRATPSSQSRAATAIATRDPDGEPSPRLLDVALAQLRKLDPERYAERMDELSYLANVLIAAPQNRHRRLRPVEALESALQTTHRGLEMALASRARRTPKDGLAAATELLKTTTADCLFRMAAGRQSSKSAKE